MWESHQGGYSLWGIHIPGTEKICGVQWTWEYGVTSTGLTHTHSISAWPPTSYWVPAPLSLPLSIYPACHPLSPPCLLEPRAMHLIFSPQQELCIWSCASASSWVPLHEWLPGSSRAKVIGEWVEGSTGGTTGQEGGKNGPKMYPALLHKCAASISPWNLSPPLLTT